MTISNIISADGLKFRDGLESDLYTNLISILKDTGPFTQGLHQDLEKSDIQKPHQISMHLSSLDFEDMYFCLILKPGITPACAVFLWFQGYLLHNEDFSILDVPSAQLLAEKMAAIHNKAANSFNLFKSTANLAKTSILSIVEEIKKTFGFTTNEQSPFLIRTAYRYPAKNKEEIKFLKDISIIDTLNKRTLSIVFQGPSLCSKNHVVALKSGFWQESYNVSMETLEVSCLGLSTTAAIALKTWLLDTWMP